MSVKDEINKLKKEIERHNFLYHSENNPEREFTISINRAWSLSNPWIFFEIKSISGGFIPLNLSRSLICELSKLSC